MAGFGDNSTTYMRSGSVAGMRIEAGCWTQGADASTHIPTTLKEVYCIVCGSEGPTEVPDISLGFIKCGLAASASGKILNYVAVGF